MKILLVEDEKKIADFITQGFQEQQVEVESVDNGLLGEQLFPGCDHARHERD
jgi:DNA-binding response OmpR family regulator